MRNPIRGEADAFRLALGGAGLTAASLAIEATIDPLAGATSVHASLHRSHRANPAADQRTGALRRIT